MSGARVLIAEDDPELRRLLAAAFLHDGYQVEEVASGFDLLVRVSGPGEELDLVVSDVRMPGLTAIEVLAGLHSPYRAAAFCTPVILITAFGDAETHADAERLGAVIFDKPFDLDDLRTCALGMVGPLQLRKSEGHWRRS